MVSINSETILPRWTAILEVVEINVKQICSSRLVVFAVKYCVKTKLGASDVCPENLHPTFVSLFIRQQLSRIYPNERSFWNLFRAGKDTYYKVKYKIS